MVAAIEAVGVRVRYLEDLAAEIAGEEDFAIDTHGRGPRHRDIE